MGKKTIVLISKNYPYMHGEEFLESELVYMEQYAEKIIIVPTAAEDYSLSRVDESDRVRVIKKPAKRARFKRIFPCLRWLFRIKVIKETIVQIRMHGFKAFTMLKVASMAEGQEYVASQLWKEIGPLVSDEKDVIFYSYWADMCAFLAAYFKRMIPGSKAITRGHGYDVYCKERGSFVPFQSEYLSEVDDIYLISNDGANYLKEKYPFLTEKINVMRLGTLDYGQGVYKYEPKTIKIVTCSSCIPLKRLELLIDTLAEVLVNVEWVHYGDGPLKNGLEDRAQERLSHNIKWTFKGRISNHELMEEYKKNSFDLFINVSESEGIPVSIMEATSFGIPVIATDVGGTKEIVINEYNGFLIKKDFKTEDLARLIMAFSKKTYEERCRYRSNARIQWERFFSAKENYKAFYKNILR